MDSISSAPRPERSRASTRPNITIGPILADASCILAIFRLSYFIPQNFHGSQPQSHSPHHRHGGALKEPPSWAVGTLALHGVWPDHLSLALPAPCGHQVAAPLPSLPGRERKVTPDRCKRTLKTECGSVQPLLEAS